MDSVITPQQTKAPFQRGLMGSYKKLQALGFDTLDIA